MIWPHTGETFSDLKLSSPSSASSHHTRNLFLCTWSQQCHSSFNTVLKIPKPLLKIYPQPFIGGRLNATRLQEARRRSGGKTFVQLLETFLSTDALALKTL